MSKFKKVLSWVLVVALTAGVSIGGTMAYLTKDVGNEKNVFTVGDIDVSLDENVEVIGDGGEVNETEEGAEYIEIMPGDYLKKEVTVTNNGKTDAYVAVTVDINNFKEIQKVIEAYGEDNADAEAMLDNVFNGWGMTVMNRYVDNTKDMSYKVNEWVDEHILHVDSAKRIVANEVAHFSILNWFKSDAEKNASGYTVAGVGNSYYAGDMEDYSLRFTYYLYLPAGESSTLFNGLNVPAEFTVDQVKMFDGLKINVNASAIQADNMAVAEQYKSDPDGKAKTAFAILAGKIAVPDFSNAPNTVDTWDGTADTSWFNDTDNEFVITTAEQLAGLAELVDGGNTFEGKTVKLDKDIDLVSLLFDPIGSYRDEKSFMGIFDGQNHIIKNLSQNTWALDNGYYYSDLGLGLFGMVNGAVVKNLTMDGADISGESGMVGIVSAVAYGDCTFENITVTNSQAADYQYYSGGIVGWASGNHQYINCNVDASTTIATQWGDFDNSTGGVIGGAGGSATIFMKDCDVACRIDAYNDVTSSYQWYAYRRCGMLIGNTGKTEAVDGTTYAAAPQLTCQNVTVTYGDWANYTYCEFAGTSWPYVRVQEGISNSAYSNPRYGHPTDANGNEVVDDNHVHNDGEDHFILCEFDQLYGGGQGVYGGTTHDGVTVIYNNK